MKGWAFFFTLVVGIALGAAGMFYGPRYLSPYLPGSLGGSAVTVEGTVLQKQKRDGSLLLTVNTSRGALLATIKKKVDEVNLLVSRGDRIDFVLKTYRPFIEDPVIKRVVKAEPEAMPGTPAEAMPVGPPPKEAKPEAAAPEAPGPEPPKEKEAVKSAPAETETPVQAPPPSATRPEKEAAPAEAGTR
jgi:hypothetical protein